MYMLLVWCSVIAAVFGSHIHGGALIFDGHGEYASAYDNYQPHDYEFNYAVSDPYTGDHKSQWEKKENGVVRGEYSLLEPDGTTRIVEYIADDHGFRAVVKKLGTSIHPTKLEAHGVSTGYAQNAAIVQTALPFAAKVEVPVATKVEVPIATKVEVPVISKVEVPVATKVEVPVATNIQVPFAQNVEYTVPSIQGNFGWAPRGEYVSVAKEAAVVNQPAVGQYVKLPTFSSYDGHASNYANVLNAAVKHLEPLSYKQPIEIPQSIELHGWQAPAGWEGSNNYGGWYGSGSHKIQYDALPQQSPALFNSQNLQYQQSKFDYQIPQSSPVINEILVPKAPGLSNIAYAEQKSVNLCPDVQANTNRIQQQTLQYVEQPQETPREGPKLNGQNAAISSQVYGTTGNLGDDSAYTNYGTQVSNYQQPLPSYGAYNVDYQDVGNYGTTQKFTRSYATPSNLLPNKNIKPLPYSFVVSHPVLK